MWQSSPDRLAIRLLAVVALAKRLQEHSSGLEDDALATSMGNAAASLAALYSVRLRELVPGLPLPSLPALVLHFQVPSPASCSHLANVSALLH